MLFWDFDSKSMANQDFIGSLKFHNMHTRKKNTCEKSVFHGIEFSYNMYTCNNIRYNTRSKMQVSWRHTERTR